jgi:hypothetical protein
MKNKRKLIIALGAVIFTPSIIPSSVAMVDALGVDCRTGFITGSLWAGKHVPEEQIVLTLQDIGNPKRSRDSTPTTREKDSQIFINTMLDGAKEVLEEISRSRREDDSHRSNIGAFIEDLRRISDKETVDPETVETILSIIFTKYAG